MNIVNVADVIRRLGSDGICLGGWIRTYSPAPPEPRPCCTKGKKARPPRAKARAGPIDSVSDGAAGQLNRREPEEWSM
jgi:hypothetical protein